MRTSACLKIVGKLHTGESRCGKQALQADYMFIRKASFWAHKIVRFCGGALVEVVKIGKNAHWKETG